MANSAWSGNTAGLASATSAGLVQAGGYNVLPAGTVLPYAGSTAPTGFLFCDGSEISKTTYAQLYSAIADVYATQTNPTTGSAWAAPSASNFRIPDYRASFLRGVGTPSVGDAVTLGGHQAQKTAKNGLSNASSDVTIANGSYSGQTVATNLGGTNYGTCSNIPCLHGTLDQDNRTGGSCAQIVTLRAPAQTITGDNETRPMNKGVNYIIKY